MLNEFSTILLDMNQTFMFGADRFGATEDYLDVCYPNPKYRGSIQFIPLQTDRSGCSAKR